MKLQHTSGAVIEDARIEERGDFFYTVCGVTRGCIYSKADWQRVPEERWEKVPLGINGIRMYIGGMSNVYGVYLPSLQPGDRYTIIDDNLCVERRVEGA